MGVEDARMLVLVLVPHALVGMAVAMNQVGRPQDGPVLQDDLGGAGREDAPVLAEDDHPARDLGNDV
jgi:hypothetical protein